MVVSGALINSGATDALLIEQYRHIKMPEIFNQEETDIWYLKLGR